MTEPEFFKIQLGTPMKMIYHLLLLAWINWKLLIEYRTSFCLNV